MFVYHHVGIIKSVVHSIYQKKVLKVNTLVLKIVKDILQLKVECVQITVVNIIIYLVVKIMLVMLNTIVDTIVVIMPLRMVLHLLKFMMKILYSVYQHVQVNTYMIELKYILKNQIMVVMQVLLHTMNVYHHVKMDTTSI